MTEVNQVVAIGQGAEGVSDDLDQLESMVSEQGHSTKGAGGATDASEEVRGPSTPQSAEGGPPTTPPRDTPERSIDAVQLSKKEQMAVAAKKADASNFRPKTEDFVVSAEDHSRAIALLGGAEVVTTDKSAQNTKQYEKIRELFNSIDADGSGKLDKGEIKQLLKMMGDRMSESQLKAAMERMDPQLTGEVGLEAFAKWWKYKQQEYRRDIRKKVREVFQLVDEDGSGVLDKGEVALLQKKIQKKFRKIEFDPPFDLDRDFSDMDKDGEGTITYDEFEQWFKVRTGDDDPDVPVLPEYMVQKIDALVTSNTSGVVLGRPRTGKELWAYLKPRLKTLVVLQSQWGNVHEVYGMQKGSMFEDAPVPQRIRDPDSTFSGFWDLAQIFFLLYVAYVVPVRVGFSIEGGNCKDPTFWFFFDAIVDIYFISDLVLNFRTAYWAPNGMLETDPRAITMNYLKSWFTIDFLSCLPVGYVQCFTKGGEGLKALKTVRLLRLFKLLRLARIKRILHKYQDVFDIQAYLGLIITFFSILFAAHMMACFWYFVGTVGGERKVVTVVNGTRLETTVHVRGWVEQDPTWCGARGDGFCTVDEINSNDPVHVSFGTRYVRSMYSTFQKEFAYTDEENLFGCIGELVVGFIYGGLAAVLSSIMVTNSASDQEYMAKMLSIKAWMKSRGITKRDKAKILAHVDSQLSSGAAFNEREILDDLPPSISGEISYRLYYKYVESLPVFRGLGREVLTHICRLVTPVNVLKEQIIYEEKTVGSEMYFIMEGEVEITKGGERLGFLGRLGFFGEQPIIDVFSSKGGDGCEIRTRTARASVDTELGVMKVEDLESLLEAYPELNIRLHNFNKFGKMLSAKGENRQKAQALKESLSVLKAGGTAGANPINATSLVSSAPGAKSEAAIEAAKKLLLATGNDLPSAAATLCSVHKPSLAS